MQGLNGLPLHHIGFAVRSLEDSCRAFEALGAKFFSTTSDMGRNLDFKFGHFDEAGGVMIEPVSPHDLEQSCIVTNMIKKQPCTLYHICLESPDLDSEIKRLKDKGFKQVSHIITSNLYGYMATGTFLFSKGTGLVELVQECEIDE